jgi:hypothetical protein
MEKMSKTNSMSAKSAAKASPKMGKPATQVVAGEAKPKPADKMPKK